MRNETDVNVAARAQVAATAGRNGSTGELPDFEPNEPQPKWWHRFVKWETITMPHKTIEKGFVVSPAITIVILGALLGMAGWAYKSSTADNRETRDSIIRMETMLNERTQTFKEQQAKTENLLDTEHRIAEMQREKQRDEMRNIKAALMQKGVRVE